MTPTLTICVPTIGRDSLRQTLDSIQRQTLIDGDRVLVVADTFEQVPAGVRDLVASYGPPFEYHEHDGGTHFNGNPQLNHAMTLADTEYFCALGDDDVYVEGAFERLRPQLQAGRAALIQFLSPPFPTAHGAQRFVFWDEPVLRVSHISGCCLVAPVSCLVPVSDEPRIEVDFDWIETVIAKTGQPPVWVKDCLVLARPEVQRGEPVRTIGRGLKVLLVAPGASTSTADVEAGLRYGLESHGVQVVRYRLDARIDRSRSWLFTAWRRAKKTNPALERPTIADVFYQAGADAITMALRHQVDAVIVVSAMLLHPDVVVLMKRAHLRVVVLFTESPYDLAQELKIAALVDACWTNERTSVDAFRAVNPLSGYLPHGWHPERHQPGPQPGDEHVRAHDVVFVGSAFQERVEWLSAIDWTGIDLGLYGTWENLGSRHPLRKYVAGAQVDNATTARLYRRAKLGLNLYRTSMGWGKDAAQIAHAESLNPRAYELAACGAFSLSTYRAEVADVFGYRVPTFTTPLDASQLIRQWLHDDHSRLKMAAELPACVAESSWVERSTRVIGDMQTLLQQWAA
jgi:glycosyltransferase involved in cell wall biosynthesis